MNRTTPKFHPKATHTSEIGTEVTKVARLGIAMLIFSAAGCSSVDEDTLLARRVEKTAVCHIDDDTGDVVMLRLPALAVSAHRKHGDSLPVPFYRDGDNDGFGAGEAVDGCEPVEGWVADNGDCNDDDPNVHPGADETNCDGVDNDCDGVADGDAEGCEDGDACTDDWCDPELGCLHEEIICDDDDPCTVDGCDPSSGCTHDSDLDDGMPCDGDDADECAEGFFECIDGELFCNDMTDDTPEICDSIDNDCDGRVDEGLGFLTCGTGVCQRIVFACLGGNPNPCEPGPSSDEVCDGLDNDCDGLTDEDDVCP